MILYSIKYLLLGTTHGSVGNNTSYKDVRLYKNTITDKQISDLYKLGPSW